MSEREEELGSLEITIEQAKKSIARKDCLVRLQQNSDFKELIEKGFLEQHAVRQVMLKAHPSLQDEKNQKMLDQQIIAIGHFKQFLIAIYTEGMSATQALREDEDTREELLREDLTNG
jgi:glutamate racemase